MSRLQLLEFLQNWFDTKGIRIDPSTTFAEAGVTSAQLVELAGVLSVRLKRTVRPIIFFDCVSCEQLVAELEPSDE